MKKIISLLFLVLVTLSCQIQEDPTALSDGASSAAPVTTAADYVNTHTFSPDGKTLTVTIDQSSSNAKDISHLNFKFQACDGSDVTLSNITAFTANGVDVMDHLGTVEGQGNDCYGMFADPFVKLDLGFSEDLVTLVISFDTHVMASSILVKAGSKNSGGGCFGLNEIGYAATRVCADLPLCYEEETAWATGKRYVTRGNWATYTPYAEGTVNVYAGQNKWAGTATMSAVVDGKVTINIALNAGWSRQEVSNPVKIQGYSVAPTGNPSPGRFASKGTELTVTLAAAKYYGIHLDVREAVACPE